MVSTGAPGRLRAGPAPSDGAGRRLAVGVLAALFVAQAVLALGAFVPVLAGSRAATVDHVSLAVAAELTARDPASLYDLDAQRAAQDALDPAGPDRPFANPPFVATAARLVEAAGIDAGYLALVALDLLAIGLLAVLVWRQGRTLAVPTRLAITTGTLAAFPVASVMAEGGVSGIAATGIALVLWGEHRRRPWPIAFGLVMAATKPHLLSAALVVLVVRRRRTALTRAVLIGTAVALPSLASPGLGAWLAYPAVFTGIAGHDSPAVAHSDHWWNVASLLHHLLGQNGSPTAVLLTWAVLAAGLAVIAATTRADGGTAAVTAALVLGLLISPHTNPADALWLPLAFVLMRTDEVWQRRPPAVRSALTGLAVTWPAASLAAFTWSTAGGSIVAVAMMTAFAVLGTAGTGRQAPSAGQADAVLDGSTPDGEPADRQSEAATAPRPDGSDTDPGAVPDGRVAAVVAVTRTGGTR
jgi:hypothetical protein